MTRTIKFRGYVPHLKKMISPCYAEIYLDGSYMIGETISWANTIPDKNDDIILMQFTGLKDKNGKEIYEGDIFQWGREKGEVIFSDGCFIFKTKIMSMTMRDHRPTEYEIIGNIYENKEL